MTQRNAILAISCNGNAVALTLNFSPQPEPGEPTDLCQMLSHVALSSIQLCVNQMSAVAFATQPHPLPQEAEGSERTQ